MQTFPLVVQTETHERPPPVPLPPAQQARPMPSAETRRFFRFSPVPLLTSGPTLPVLLQEFHSRLRTYRNAHPIHSALRPGQRPSNTPENESLTSGNGSGGRPRPARPLPASGFPSRGIAAHRPPLFLACARRVPAWARQSHFPVSASLWPQSSARSRTSQKSQRRCRLLRQTLLDQRI